MIASCVVNIIQFHSSHTIPQQSGQTNEDGNGDEKRKKKKTVPETTWKSRTKLFTPRGNGKSRKEKKIPKVGYIDTKFFFCFPPAAGARFALKIAIDGRVGVQTIDTRLLTTLFDLFFAC